MVAAIPLREDFDAAELRRLASGAGMRRPVVYLALAVI